MRSGEEAAAAAAEEKAAGSRTGEDATLRRRCCISRHFTLHHRCVNASYPFLTVATQLTRQIAAASLPLGSRSTNIVRPWPAGAGRGAPAHSVPVNKGTNSGTRETNAVVVCACVIRFIERSNG
ncbi:hypothetical protein EVAR_21624_1 [Eumeta japonica]|uniref:Uncharacterized protein n=1 Tax=Eumeta variegata TaxID=151549 RepID=A0A4C1UYT4_EUMVA|nr:hypothetical protein EVAR_21624_1 [Eumeta japonica]